MSRKARRNVSKNYRLLKRKGQTLVEYGLILVLVSIVAISALRAIFGKTTSPYEDASNAFP